MFSLLYYPVILPRLQRNVKRFFQIFPAVWGGSVHFPAPRRISSSEGGHNHCVTNVPLPPRKEEHTSTGTRYRRASSTLRSWST